ncbi:MAG: adenylyltransferase/cytidyltransferase family protein [Chlamydiia bacterium]|nr:adenylyltransferase/cytidyltransferase family protein [Chlamydiia bacterium]
MVSGAFWGAFDPLTSAHKAIVDTAIKEIELDRLYIVVNNHPYKNYTYPLEERIKAWRSWLDLKGFKQVELLSQDEAHLWDREALEAKSGQKIIAIAGYDAYQRWRAGAKKEALQNFDKIAVVPRGNEPPDLFDENALLLKIPEAYRYVSSAKVKKDRGDA